MNKLFFTFFLGLLLVGSVSAASWYVDNAVATSGNGQSWSTAWNSFSNIVWSSVQPGDIIYISGGSSGGSQKYYNSTLSIGASGTIENHIIITKGVDIGHNGKVVLDGLSTYGYGVSIKNKKYITISKLDITGWSTAVYISGSSGSVYSAQNAASNIIIENLYMFTTLGRGVFIQTSDNIIIRNNYIITPDDVPEQTDGIYSQRSFDNIYEYNTIIINNVNNCNSCHNDGIQGYLDTDITYRYNYIEQNNTKHDGNAQGIYVTTSNGTLYAYGNVVYGPNTRNALLTNANYFGSVATMIAYGNTLVGGGWGVLSFKDSAESIAKNNIIVSYQSGAVLPRIEGGYSSPKNWDYNLYYAPNSSYFFNNTIKNFAQWQAAGFDIHGKYGDPRFIEVKTAGNFRLLSSSPAIDIGASLGAPYNYDKDGVSRPQGTAWDIGAYEYVGGTVSCVSVSPADNSPCDGCISLGEISEYVGLWLNGSGVTLSQVSEGVNEWMKGC
jgi:hypothetical protein